jgi:hypothetical protein
MDCKINDLNPRILSFVDIPLLVKQCTVRSLYGVRHYRSKDRNVKLTWVFFLQHNCSRRDMVLSKFGGLPARLNLFKKMEVYEA